MSRKKRGPTPTQASPPPAVAAVVEKASRRTLALIAVGLAVLTLAVYWQVSGHDFINLDDPKYVTKNDHVNQGLTGGGIWWALTSVSYYYWQPLTWISHMFDVQLFGLKAGGHHMVNVAIHIANTVLLFLVFYVMTGSVWRSAMVGAMFGLHPLRVESVAWVAERKDVLAGLFWILAVGAYAKKRPAWVAAFFTLGIMSKPSVVTLPFALLLLDVWPLGRIDLRSRNWLEQARTALREKVPLLALVAAASVATFFGQSTMGATVSLQALPFWYRVNNAVLSYIRYLGKFFWPADLGVLYPYERIYEWEVWCSSALLLAISYGTIRLARRAPYLACGWLWFLGVLVPTIGLAQVGVQSFADRFTYLPLIGLFAAVVWGVSDLMARMPRMKAALAAVLVMAMTLLSWRQTEWWKNSFSLFEHTVAVTRDNDILHINLASLYAERNSYPMAISHYREAIRIEPTNVDARYLLVGIYQRQEDWNAAIDECRQILRVRPSYQPARRTLNELLRNGSGSEPRTQGEPAANRPDGAGLPVQPH